MPGTLVASMEAKARMDDERQDSHPDREGDQSIESQAGMRPLLAGEGLGILLNKEGRMPSVKKVKLSDAPRVVKTPLAKRGLEYDGYVNMVGAGEALRFELGSGETVRAIRSRLYAAARRMEKDIDVWDVDGVVYCALK